MCSSFPKNQNQTKSSLYSRYYAEACNELRGPSPRLSAWATQLRSNVATVASRWRYCVAFTSPGIEPLTSRTVSVRLATELTAGLVSNKTSEKKNFCHYHVKVRIYSPSILAVEHNFVFIGCKSEGWLVVSGKRNLRGKVIGRKEKCSTCKHTRARTESVQSCPDKPST